MSETSKKKTLATVAGGIKATATIVKEGETTEEPIFIRELPVRKLQDYIELQSSLNEAAVVELFCNKEVGWADTLLNKTFEEILEKGEELNRPILDSWLKRSRATMSRIADEVNAIAEATSRSQTSSQTPQ